MFSRKGIFAYLLVAVLVLPSAAAASKPGSAADQYGEKCLTASGPKPCALVNSKGVKPSAKVKSALNTLKNGSRKNHLSELAASSGGGAPTGTLKGHDVGNSSFGKSLGATILATSGGSTARLVILLIAIIGSTATIGILAIRRQRTLP